MHIRDFEKDPLMADDIRRHTMPGRHGTQSLVIHVRCGNEDDGEPYDWTPTPPDGYEYGEGYILDGEQTIEVLPFEETAEHNLIAASDAVAALGKVYNRVESCGGGCGASGYGVYAWFEWREGRTYKVCLSCGWEDIQPGATDDLTENTHCADLAIAELQACVEDKAGARERAAEREGSGDDA